MRMVFRPCFCNILILNIFEESVECEAIKNLGIFLPNGRGVGGLHPSLQNPHSSHSVALSLPFLGTAHPDGQDQFFKEVTKLLESILICQLIQ